MKSLRLDPRSIILFCIMISSLVFSCGSLYIKAGLFVLTLLCALMFGLLNRGVFLLFYRLRYLLISLLVLQVLFRKGGQVYWSFGILSITEAGIRYAFSSFLNYGVLISGSILLSSISLDKFFMVFRYYRLPSELTLTLSFGVQYINTFSGQISNIKQSIRQRNLMSGRNPIKKLKIIRELIIPVLVKSLSEVQYKAIALELKGISLKSKSRCSLRFRSRDIIFLLVSVIIAGYLFYLERHFS